MKKGSRSSIPTSPLSKDVGAAEPAQVNDSSVVPLDVHAALETLVAQVTSTIGIPLDHWAVAATLESLGVRDVDAREKYGYASIFPLSEFVYGLIMDDPPEVKCPTRQNGVETRRERAFRVLTHLLEGSFFAMPMVGQIICILLTRYSLWASLDFTEQQATLIGLGTVASFAATGGVVMSLGRQGTVYRGMKAYTLLRRVCVQLVAVGMVVSLVSLAFAACINLISPFLSTSHFVVASMYYLCLCGMWLSLGLLYMLGKHMWSTGVTLGFGALVALEVRWLGVGVETAQLSSIGCATFVAFVVAGRTMRALQKDEDPRYVAAPPPPPDVAAGILAPFGVYGLGYFGFLFLDRVLAWTAPGRPLPMPVWFHTPYELGMDWALISLLLPMAYLEHVVHEFGPRIMREQDQMRYDEVVRHRSSMMRFGFVSLSVVVTLSLLSVVGTYYAVQALRAFEEVKEIRDFFASDITQWVFWVAAVGYQLLTWALMVGLLFFTLARQETVVRAMWVCLTIGLVVGYSASRILGPEWAVLGFAVGALYFAVTMGIAGFRLSRRIDYFYYSAY